MVARRGALRTPLALLSPVRSLPSLRQRVLVLFGLLAVCPLLALGLLDYVRGQRAVERIVGEQTDAAVTEMARLVAQRMALVESDAMLLGGNDDTQALLEAERTRPDAAPALRAVADSFASLFWSNAQTLYFAAEVRGVDGRILLQVPMDSARERVTTREMAPFSFPVRGADGQTVIGTVVLHPRREGLVPANLAVLAFGRTGQVQLLDTATSVAVYDSRGLRGPASSSTIGIATRRTAQSTLAIVRSVEDSSRLASVLVIPGSPWMALSATSLTEFTGGLNDARSRDLLLLVLATLALSGVFALLLRRSTQSLESLTRAAQRVAAGERRPALPAAGTDEIGTLTRAFDHMLQRVDAMMQEIEVSRQLAVLGEFSAQLSHEIRNPLTAIKLNLQELSRDVKRGQLPQRAALPVDTCLAEVQRLDGVVRGVLALTRASTVDPILTSVHEVLRRVLALHATALEAQQVAVATDLRATDSSILGDEAQLVSLFSNIVVNALQAQPRGGRIVVRTALEGDALVVYVADDGPGVPPMLRDRIFRPFVSGLPTGTGIGLSLALTVARNHGGTLVLEPAADGETRGACFRVTLPLASAASERRAS